MRAGQWTVLLAALMLAATPQAVAKPKKGVPGGPPAHAAERGRDIKGPPEHVDDGRFSLGDIEVVRSFFGARPHYRGGPLPPGVAKNYARGKPLPPGIAKRFVPGDLIVLLPPRPGHEYLIVDDDVVLVAIATGVVIDIIFDVFG